MTEYAWSVAIPMGALVLSLLGIVLHARWSRRRAGRKSAQAIAASRAQRRERAEQWYRDRKAEEARYLRDIGWTDLTAPEESSSGN